MGAPGRPADRQSPEYQERLRSARRVRFWIVTAELLLGVAVGVLIGVLTDSIAWGIVAAVVTGLLLVVLGSVVFVSSGGLTWLRQRGASPN